MKLGIMVKWIERVYCSDRRYGGPSWESQKHMGTVLNFDDDVIIVDEGLKHRPTVLRRDNPTLHELV